MTLSVEQQYALDLFKKGENIFLTGSAGTGKTKVIHHFLEYSRIMGNPIQVCALTGCAAILLNCNAKTIHSWSGIKLAKGKNVDIIASVLRNRKVVSSWRKVRVLVIDEVSMLSQKIFEILNELGQITRKRFDVPFGGIQVVFAGDFFQLPPVGNAIYEPETANFCFESPAWFSVFPPKNHVELKTVFRQKDPVYVKILAEIRQGTISNESVQILQKYVKREYNPQEHGGCIPTKIFPLRSKTEYVNNEMFAKIDQPIYEFHYDAVFNNKLDLNTKQPFPMEIIDRTKDFSKEETDKIIDSYLNNIPCSPILSLKKGVSVMCVVNLDMDVGICNGSQGIIVDFVENDENTHPIVKFHNGIVRPVHYHYWQIEDYPTITIGQLPLMLSWAMTIHKIQGTTIPMAEIDIGDTVFEYGQIYVALSRLQTLDGLYLIHFNPYKIKSNPKVVDFYSKIEPISVSSSFLPPPQPPHPDVIADPSVKKIRL